MYSYGPPHMAGQKQDDQLEHTYSSYVRILDVALRTCQRRWAIGRSGERGSGISVPAAQHDDIYIYKNKIWLSIAIKCGYVINPNKLTLLDYIISIIFSYMRLEKVRFNMDGVLVTCKKKISLTLYLPSSMNFPIRILNKSNHVYWARNTNSASDCESAVFEIIAITPRSTLIRSGRTSLDSTNG